MESQSDANLAGPRSSIRSSSPRYSPLSTGPLAAEGPAEMAAAQQVRGPTGAPPKSSSRRPSSSPQWLSAKVERGWGHYSGLEKLMMLTCITVLVSNLAILVFGVILVVLTLRG
ncbi:MAG TPA: hypothetical protein PLX89_10835 [Verrucomicrobiota bacterium]|nr:hypothetical protein [Verrucomicrobiales bacterium]HRI13492.1 hypothetical protein [Verrucomicrobiota bacterium]